MIICLVEDPFKSKPGMSEKFQYSIGKFLDIDPVEHIIKSKTEIPHLKFSSHISCPVYI